MIPRGTLTVVILWAAAMSIEARTSQALGAEPRELREIAADWRFQIDVRNVGEHENWYAINHDRSGWRAATVPQAWDLFDTALRGYENVGWYAVKLDGSWARPEKTQVLKFGRVMYHAKVWLNGEFLGEHIDGYLPFAWDVTGKLKNADNLLVLRVDNRPRIDWPPAAKQIEWVQYGGILQPVRVETSALISVSDVAVRFVPEQNGAVMACDVEISARESAEDLVLQLEVAGQPGTRQTRAITARAGSRSRHPFDLRLAHAKWWSPQSPSRYSLTAALIRGGIESDRVTVKTGMRTIGTRGRELLLNGKPLRIQGVNRYDEYGDFGPNPPLQLVEDELRLMKKTGINLIRSHYPQSPEFLELCDRVGMLFLEELPINWWGVDWYGTEGLVQDERILDLALPMLETMVRRDRHHPCVIIWSMANESKTDNDVGIKVMKTLIRRTKELDPTRLVTFVTAPGSVREHRGYEDAHLVATNMYFGSLGGSMAVHRDQLDARARRPSEEHLRRQIAAYPDKPLLIAEFGAMGIRNTHGDIAGTEDFQADYLRAVWQAICAVPEVAGGVVWSWADYQHRRQFQSLGSFGAFGAVTIDRQRKAALGALASMYAANPDR